MSILQRFKRGRGGENGAAASSGAPPTAEEEAEKKEAEKKEASREQMYSGPPVADLQQIDVINQLKKMGVQQEEAAMRVQTALVFASTMDREQINAISSSKEPLTLESLPLRWAAHCIYHGARPQRLF